MFKLLIKFPVYFAISFLILSIPINRKSLFYYVDEFTSQFTHPINVQIGKNLSKGNQLLKEISKKLFSTNIPSNLDSIQSNMSGRQRVKTENLVIETDETVEHEEIYTKEDKSLLKEVLRNNE